MRIGKKIRYLYILLMVNLSVVLCLANTGCQTNIQPISNLNGLIDRLENSGLEVEITDQAVRNIHLSVEGYIFIIDGENTQLFEYSDVDTAEMQFKALTRSGTGLVFFEENEPPLSESVSCHLKVYHSGRFTLLYSGHNEDVKKALKAALGQPSQPR